MSPNHDFIEGFFQIPPIRGKSIELVTYTVNELTYGSFLKMKRSGTSMTKQISRGPGPQSAERLHRRCRRIKSCWDIVVYRYCTLARNFELWITGFILILILSVLFVRTLRDNPWIVVPPGLTIWVSLLVTFIFFVLGSMIKRSGSDRSQAIGEIDEQIDKALRESLDKVLPSKSEEYSGFMTRASPSTPHGPVVFSDRFNENCMANPAWDMKLHRLRKEDTYDLIISSLRSRSWILSKYLTKKFATAFLSINPLTNDLKIGFFSQINEGSEYIDIFQTDYFTGLCTEALTIKNLISINRAGKREVKFKASAYCHIECKNGTAYRLLDFDDMTKPCSLQGGIEVLAISSDYYLRLAIQSKYAQYSGETRAPLASGSMDWEDQEGCKYLKELIVKASRRELVEEWGKKHHKLPDLRVKEGKICPIGFFRMPHRGGKPQFVVFARLENKDFELRPDPTEVNEDLSDEAHARFHVPDLESLRWAVARMIEGGGWYYDSVPLYGALLCLQHAIDRHPEIICDVAGYTTPTALPQP